MFLQPPCCHIRDKKKPSVPPSFTVQAWFGNVCPLWQGLEHFFSWKPIVLSVFTASNMSFAEKIPISLICFSIQSCLRRDYIGGQRITQVVQKENGIIFPSWKRTSISGLAPCFLFCPHHHIVQPDHWITSVQPASVSSFQKKTKLFSVLFPPLLLAQWDGADQIM